MEYILRYTIKCCNSDSCRDTYNRSEEFVKLPNLKEFLEKLKNREDKLLIGYTVLECKELKI